MLGGRRGTARPLGDELGGVVVGGEPESARDDGVVAHLRDADVAVGTTAAIGDPAGRVSVIRAIVEGEGE